MVYGTKMEIKANDLLLVLDFNETMELLAMTSSVYLCDHVLRWEDGDVLRRALQLEGEGQMTEFWLNQMWIEQVEEEIMNHGLVREHVLC